MSAAVDVLVPCALGGILDHESVPQLQTPAIAAPPTTSWRLDVADLLRERGVLWAPDFVANAGGIVNIAVELDPQGQ